MSKGLRSEALPCQLLLEAILRKRVPVEMICDNTQALAAIEKGYSKKLRALSRSQRVSIGVLHEVFRDPTMKISATYAASRDQLADIFTKALLPADFAAQRSAIGVIPDT